MYLESASMPGFFITMNNNTFGLENLSKDNKYLLNQAMYIENPKTTDINIMNDMISIKTANTESQLNLASENKIVKAYANINTVEAKSNMTFIVHRKSFRYVITIITIYNGSVKTMSDEVVGVLDNNSTDGTSYFVNQHSNLNNNFDIFKDQFTLQNTKTNTYIDFDTTTRLLYDRVSQPNTNSIFNFELQNGFYKIVSSDNSNFIMLQNRKILKLSSDSEKNIMSNDNLFKIQIKYELI